MPDQARIIHGSVRGLALSAFAFYLVWNAIWLAHGRVPPSILRAFSGIPSPTTGGTRSLIALSHGDVLQSLLWNPLTLVYLMLFAYSIAVLARQAFTRQRLILNKYVAWTWFAALAIGWTAKFAIGKKYW